jgi:hypothetical protein
MSRGLGKVQNAILKYLTSRRYITIRELHSLFFRGGGDYWKNKAVTKAAISRALQSLEKRELIEKFDLEKENKNIPAVGLAKFVNAYSEAVNAYEENQNPSGVAVKENKELTGSG